MFDYDKWQEIYLSIKKHKLRALLTAFGVFWGIFMLVILLGSGKGLENGAKQGFDINKNTVFLWTQRTSKPYKGLRPGRFIQLNNQDIEALQSIPELATISARTPLRGDYSVDYSTRTANFSVFGDYPDFTKVNPIWVTNGRFLNDKDIKEFRKIAVIGKRVQEVLFPPDMDPVGEYIKIKGIPFKVVGVFDTKSKGEDARDELQTIYIPNTTLQRAFNMPNMVGWFALLPQEGIPAKVVEEKAKALLAQRHLVHPEDQRAFGSANIEEEYRKMQTVFTGISGFSWLVAIGTIIAGVVGVGNIMMIIVRERTKEIGIRKSLGATPWSIISMILQEAIVLTSVAGYAGLAIGCGLIAAINYAIDNLGMDTRFFYNPELDFMTAFWALIVLLLAGALAGLIPGIRAANVNPVIALRDQ
jgi:putative ABC transport system permease protein